MVGRSLDRPIKSDTGQEGSDRCGKAELRKVYLRLPEMFVFLSETLTSVRIFLS